jgi:hypothetical protein
MINTVFGFMNQRVLTNAPASPFAYLDSLSVWSSLGQPKFKAPKAQALTHAGAMPASTLPAQRPHLSILSSAS